MKFTSPDIWKWYARLLGIHTDWANTKDFRMFGCQSENKFILIKTKHPIDMIMFGVVTSDGDVMPSFIFPHGLTETYIKCLEEVILTGIERVAAGRSHVWQKDSASCHTSKKVPYWLRGNF